MYGVLGETAITNWATRPGPTQIFKSGFTLEPPRELLKILLPRFIPHLKQIRMWMSGGEKQVSVLFKDSWGTPVCNKICTAPLGLLCLIFFFFFLVIKEKGEVFCLFFF